MSVLNMKSIALLLAFSSYLTFTEGQIYHLDQCKSSEFKIGYFYRCNRLQPGVYTLASDETVERIDVKRVDSNVHFIIPYSIGMTLKLIKINDGFCPIITEKGKKEPTIEVRLNSKKCKVLNCLVCPPPSDGENPFVCLFVCYNNMSYPLL